MSLQVWLPLNKNIIENKGLSDVVFTNSRPSDITFTDSGIESCYSFNSTSTTNNFGIYNGNENNEFMDKYINHHSFSIGGWFKTTSTSSGYGTGGIPLVCLTYGIWLHVGNATCLTLYSQRVSTEYCDANMTTNDGKWHHVMGTYNISDNKMRIYVDGSLKNTVNYISGETYASQWNNMLYIGRNPNNSRLEYDYFQGSMADIRIYDHALSDKEVAELAKGLMFHLKLDNTDVYDVSGYGWGVSKYSSGALTESTDTARYGKSLTFSNTYLTLPYLIKYDLQEFTISYWIKYNTLSGASIFGARTNLYSGCYSALGGDGQTIWMVRFDTKQQNYSPGSYSLQANKWYHVICIYKAGQFVKVYADDKSVTYTGTDAISMTNTNMNYNQISDTNFNGSISDFRIYRTALTDEQVRELYKVGGSIDNHGNAHCYEFSESSGYAFELNNYILDGNNWIDTGICPYNTNKNFEIEITIDCLSRVGSSNEWIVSNVTYDETDPAYMGFRVMYDANLQYQRFYCSSAMGEDYGIITSSDSGIHSYRYTYNDGVSKGYLDGNLLYTSNRTLNSSHSLKIGVGNYESDSWFLEDKTRWKGTIKHFHLKYLE